MELHVVFCFVYLIVTIFNTPITICMYMYFVSSFQFCKIKTVDHYAMMIYFHISCNQSYHANTLVSFKTHHTPLLYSKTGVYRGIHFFSLKHRLWLLVTIYVLSKNKKKITIFHLKITIFAAMKNRCLLPRHVCVMKSRV